jgi:hypothetical protein
MPALVTKACTMLWLSAAPIWQSFRSPVLKAKVRIKKATVLMVKHRCLMISHSCV